MMSLVAELSFKAKLVREAELLIIGYAELVKEHKKGKFMLGDKVSQLFIQS